ncbi:MAG: glutamate-5-semialdehyde dehydrogenase [Lachnospiraceae bacterium]|nr:glutamate-5-semialdehyde dehydrogenase [Lachnospiraceae bacterium]
MAIENKELIRIGENAVKAKYVAAALGTELKNKILRECAEELVACKGELLSANALDIKKAEEAGMNPGLIDRLKLSPERIEGIAEGIRQVADLPDYIGEVIEETTRPNGLNIKKVRVPLGVVGIIFESRPNVTADAFSLTFKSGNAVILKGGSDALRSNMAIVGALRSVCEENGVDPNVVQLIEHTDRAVTKEFMKMKEYVDVLIPRGSARLIKSVTEEALIPVIETGSGNCHVYVDKEADLDMATDIIFNAKTQRISVCNACESLIVHSAIKDEFLPVLKKRLDEKNVELRADERSFEALGGEAVKATEEDFGTEYLDYILSIKTVDSVEEAIEHINKYNTGHSEAIITKDESTAEKFLNGVDAACVYVNASTRFTDGFEFGFGAEIGISTQMLHARGPMGLRELTSYKYKVYGDGQVRQ